MLNLDHIGIAVLDLEKSIKRYQSDFGLQLELRESLPEQKIDLAFLKLENTSIELLAAADEGSTISKFLQKRGEGLHHVCYKVQDIRKEIQVLTSKGYQLIDKEPRKGARNTLIVFIHPGNTGGVLTELCQYLHD
jgi:methylmalonyl-CoA/ethylmalonyl-CoA epimerase